MILLKNIKNKILKFFFKHPILKIKDSKKFKYSYLGSKHGGWFLVDDDISKESLILSVGLGEDASFDIELINKYHSKILILDPTPNAIDHYNNILNSIGNSKISSYSETGKQSISSYDLKNIDIKNFVFLPKALWTSSGKIKFYKPLNSDHISHSIINFQNNYSKFSEYIEVESICIDDLALQMKIDLKKITLMKLDIEGAEIEVLEDCMNKNFKPRQILVEFDELNLFSIKGYKRVYRAHNLLIKNGYQLLKNDKKSNFLYYKK